MKPAVLFFLTVFVVVASLFYFSPAALAEASTTTFSNPTSPTTSTSTSSSPTTPSPSPCPDTNFTGPDPTPAPLSNCTFGAAQESDFFVTNTFAHTLVGCWGIGESLIKGSDQGCLSGTDTSTGTSSAMGPTQFMVYQKIPQGGLAGGLSNVMLAMYQAPPTSTELYLARAEENLGLVKPAYAAGPSGINGAGDGVIEPVLALWQFARNIAYLAFTLVFVLVGFMIMFRRKMNAQTVISIQSALPTLIIGLALVTFSYLISAAIIDLAFVGVKVVAGVFVAVSKSCTVGGTGIGPSNPCGIGDAYNLADNGNFLNLWGSFIWNSGIRENVIGPLKDAVTTLIGGAVGAGVKTTAPWLIPTPIPNIIGFVVGHAAGFVIGGAVGLLAAIVLICALLVQLFRLTVELIRAYVTILITTILSPFIILMACIPGNGGKMEGWWKTLLANALIFPAVFGAFMFASYILALNASGTGFNQTLPFFTGLPTNLVGSLIGFGVVLATPGIPNMVKEAFHVRDVTLGQESQAGAARGWAFAGIWGGLAGRQTVRQVHNVAERRVRDAVIAGNPPPAAAEFIRHGTRTLWGHNDWFPRRTRRP